MKLIALVLPCSLILSACASEADTVKPPRVGMANPASVYCDQQGGTRIAVETPQGTRSDCKLPSGEVMDEWDLWRRDHPAPEK